MESERATTHVGTSRKRSGPHVRRRGAHVCGESDRPRGVAALVVQTLGGVANGRLSRLPVTVRFWDGSELASDRRATVVFRDPAAVMQLLRAPGQLGLARAWVDGSLDVEGDLEAVLRTRDAFAGVRVSARDRARLALAALKAVGVRGLRPARVPAVEARIGGRLRSLSRDRNAVRHHYDVSNRFYRLVLGPTMVYSCAYFARPEDTLETAQQRKLELICRKLALRDGERLLDIGCGWGSLLIYAAQHHGVHALGVTLSEPQAEFARARIAELGLADRVEVRVQDYREIEDGPFDKIASVGMYEHVGRDQLGHYVQTVMQLLRPGGLFLNQGITRLAPHPPKPDPFIARYVFPDGELHPVTDILAIMQSLHFEFRDVESLRDHYPLTLRRWAANLEASRGQAIAEVGSQRERVWRLYMIASALGFEDGELSIYQVLAARPGAPHGLPLERTRLLTPSA